MAVCDVAPRGLPMAATFIGNSTAIQVSEAMCLLFVVCLVIVCLLFIVVILMAATFIGNSTATQVLSVFIVCLLNVHLLTT